MVSLKVPCIASDNTHILQAVADLEVLGIPVQFAGGGAVQGEQIQTHNYTQADWRTSCLAKNTGTRLSLSKKFTRVPSVRF